MTRQLIKTFNGYSVVYHSEYKYNKFVILDRGKVAVKFEDFRSCLIWIDAHTRNFEVLENGR